MFSRICFPIASQLRRNITTSSTICNESSNKITSLDFRLSIRSDVGNWLSKSKMISRHQIVNQTYHCEFIWTILDHNSNILKRFSSFNITSARLVFLYPHLTSFFDKCILVLYFPLNCTIISLMMCHVSGEPIVFCLQNIYLAPSWLWSIFVSREILK